MQSTGDLPPAVLQVDDGDCGLACLAVALQAKGHAVSLQQLRRRAGPRHRQIDLSQLSRIARCHGIGTKAVRIDLTSLRDLRLPAILHWNLDHYVLLWDRIQDGWRIHDPAEGWTVVTEHSLNESFTGVALELAVAASESHAPPSTALSNSPRLSLSPHLISALVLKAALPATAVMCLAYVLSANGSQIDATLVGVLVFFASLSAGLSFAFKVFWERVADDAVRETGVTAMRRSVFCDFEEIQSWSWKALAGAFEASLSFAYARLNQLTNSIYAAAAALASIFCLVLLDYRLAIAITLLGIAMLAANKAFPTNAARLALVRARHLELANEVFFCNASIRTSQFPLRWVNRWISTFSLYSNARQAACERKFYRSCSITCFVFSSRLAFVVLFVIFSPANSVPIVQVIAAFLLNEMAVDAVRRLAKSEALGVHGRIEELLPSEAGNCRTTEEVADQQLADLSIELESVSYCRRDGASVLHNISLSVRPGERVAVVGESGSGKTTLLLLCAGLLQPTSGRVCFFSGGAEVRSDKARRLAAAVLQTDTIFTGTVRENISCFEDDVDDAWVAECARLAGVKREMESLPQGFETRLQRNAPDLSVGQRQRLLLARALYRRPRILMLDEATANLDPRREDLLLRHLSTLGIGILLVTHSERAARRADSVYRLQAGHLHRSNEYAK